MLSSCQFSAPCAIRHSEKIQDNFGSDQICPQFAGADSPPRTTANWPRGCSAADDHPETAKRGGPSQALENPETSNCAARRQCEANTGRMKKRRRNRETCTEGKCSRGSKFTAMRMTVEQRKHPDNASGGGNRQTQRKRHRQTEPRPSARTETRIMGSTNGSPTPATAATNPTIITPTKDKGRAQIARPPRAAAHRPTATIARI